MLSRPALACAAAYVALELAEAFTQNAADALFLARHGAGALGFVLAASSALVAVTVGLTGALADRGERPRLFFRLGVAAAALLVLARGALALAPAAASIALMIVAKQTSAALDLAFWVVVADRFHAREGRRLVPILTFAGGAGMALASFATRAVAAVVSVEGLLLVAAAFTAAAAAAVGALAAEPSPPAAGVPLWTAWKEGAAATARSPLYRRLVAVVAAVGAFGPILFTAFGAAAAEAHPGAVDLAAFLGRFRGLTCLATLAAQAALGPAFFHFFGVGNAFLLAPLVGVVAGAALCARPELVVAAAALAAARVLDAAVQTPAEKLAHNLAAPRLRGRVGAFLDGVAKRSGALAGGIAAGLVAAPPLVLAAAVGWLAAALALRRRYASLAVGELLRSPAPREALPAVDEATLRLLRRDLGGDD
ncbi:MAG TPA: hypothetical protein VKE22_00410, partial [Haliangiales bacterium]|nr:hypothetical protein [Haliangiales bacterium]